MRALFFSIREMFMDWHWFSAINQPWRTLFFLVMYLLLCWLLYEFLRRLVIPLIMILQKKAIKVIGVRFINKKVLVRFNEILLGWFFYVIVPTAFDEKDDWEKLLLRITASYIMVAILRLINTFIEAIINLTQRNKGATAHPLKGVHQLIQIILFLIGFVFAMAILFDKSPTTLLAGLGASAAVLMLIFKDRSEERRVGKECRL